MNRVLERNLRKIVYKRMKAKGRGGLTLVLQMLESIQDKPGIDTAAHSELADLETEIRPEDVLSEIENLQENLKWVV